MSISPALDAVGLTVYESATPTVSAQTRYITATLPPPKTIFWLQNKVQL